MDKEGNAIRLAQPRVLVQHSQWKSRNGCAGGSIMRLGQEHHVYLLDIMIIT